MDTRKSPLSHPILLPFFPQLICSYVLRPVAFLMGVAWEDCSVVAELLGIKLFLNEFVAYQELSQYKQRRLAGAEEWLGDKKQWISVSVLICSLQHRDGTVLPRALNGCFVFPWACLRHSEVVLSHTYPAILGDQTGLAALSL